MHFKPHLDSVNPSQAAFLPLAAVAAIFLALTSSTDVFGDDQPATPSPVTHRVTGLFSKEREADLRVAFQKLPAITLVSIDYDNGEAAFDYDPQQAFPDAKPDEIVERFDNALRGASNYTFGIRPRCTVPREKLEFVEIAVVGLDCKGCCLGAYEAIYRLEGVERATASFKDGRVTALIDPNKTNRAKLEKALTQRGVELKSADSPGKS